MVVVGGTAGLEAARRLALRGVRTVLFEAAERLGGQMRLWSDTPSRREFPAILDWWESALRLLQVQLRPGTVARPPT